MRRALAALAALALLAALAALVGSGSASGQNTQLTATVGPGFTISVRNAAGAPVTQLDPGTYDIVVEDLSAEHNFHLTGPGVNRSTTVEGTGTEMWTVTLSEGVYRFVCDPHATVMRGSFTAGTPPPPPPKPPTPTKLTGTVGPGFTISLRRPSGVAVKTLKAGTYAITVRDRSRFHNFHLTGAGVNRRTGVPYSGTTAKAWTVKLAKGTLRWLCDPHALRMRGSAKVT
jgi:plastocyanin